MCVSSFLPTFYLYALRQLHAFSLPTFLLPSLYVSLPPSNLPPSFLPHSFPYSLPPSLTPSLPHSIPPCLTHSLPPLLILYSLPPFSQRDLAALEKQVKLLSQETQRLSTTYPDKATHVGRKEQQAVTVWRALISKSSARKSKLVEAEQLQRFLNDFRDLR